ncbi:MAG: tyrosine-type recombinase/integrase [Planctomycetota bacterium]|nr:tyrosine-type recombinase/integrase [Planctomycetota bacterium]
MPHFPKPYFRESRRSWFVQINGHETNLGPDKDAAFLKYHELMQQPAPLLPSEAVIVLTDAFLDWCHKNRASRSYDWYKEHIQSFADTIPASLTVAQLRPFHVQQWVDGKDWSDGMKRGSIIAVQRALNWAVELGFIAKSPLAHFKKPRAGKRETIITPKLYGEISRRFDQPFRDLLTLAWETGARPQELLALEGRHVDLGAFRLVFPQKEAKGRKHLRIIYLNDAALAVIGRLLLKYPEGKLLRNEDEKPWTRHAVSCRFLRLKKRIGLKLCLYNFRHSFCHRAIKNGVDPITLANLMGHVDTAMIARVYSNLSQDPGYLRDSLKRATA